MGGGVARINGGYRYNDRVLVVLSTWCGSIYRVGSSRYIEYEVVDLSTGADSFYRFADVVLSVYRYGCCPRVMARTVAIDAFDPNYPY